MHTEVTVVDDRTVKAIATAAVWLVVVVIARWFLRHAFATWEKRHAEVDPIAIAQRRTTFSFLSRIVVAIVVVVGTWSVLSIYPQTTQVARALLASSVVLALIAGLALNTPLGNLGSGVLVAFTQPLRLGDGVTIGDKTGFVEQINLIYTVLVTDDERRIYIPNTQLTTNAIVNRTIHDPRRSVTALLPVRLGVPLEQARSVVLAAAHGVPGAEQLEVRVTVGDVSDKLVWLSATALAPIDADVATLGSDIRERALAALGDAGLLPQS